MFGAENPARQYECDDGPAASDSRASDTTPEVCAASDRDNRELHQSREASGRERNES
jgi:hypothetical protein